MLTLSAVQLLSTTDDQVAGQGTYDTRQVVRFSAVQISQTLIRVAIYHCPDRTTPADSPTMINRVERRNDIATLEVLVEGRQRKTFLLDNT
jgi:hypothetical protein